jgi:hypothetical protein
VLVNNVPFGDLMRRSLAEVGHTLWANDAIAAVIDGLPEELKRTVALGDAVVEASPSVRRFLEVYAPLLRVRATKGSLKEDLLLIDVPFGTSASYQIVIGQCIKELQQRGATIVCAGVPETLENMFSSVIRLRAVDSNAQDGKLSRYFDIRMAQKSEVSINR